MRIDPRRAAIALIALLAAVASGTQFVPGGDGTRPAMPATNTAAGSPGPGDHGQMLRLDATVLRVLRDDNDGSRHQRFLVRTTDGASILVAHNIDLAPRVPDLVGGDPITLFGQFECNERGGVLHWTHRAPRGDHAEGWIDYRGRRYR